MTMHERAVDAAMEIECKKDRLAQNQDGTWKLTLTVAPDGLPDAVMKAPPGVRYRAFFVEVDDQEEPVKHAPAPSEKPKKRFHELPLSQQAALRCQDEGFWNFIIAIHPHYWADQGDKEKSAIAAVYRWSGISSRAELDHDTEAGRTWSVLNAAYEEYAGLAPQSR